MELPHAELYKFASVSGMIICSVLGAYYESKRNHAFWSILASSLSGGLFGILIGSLFIALWPLSLIPIICTIQ